MPDFDRCTCDDDIHDEHTCPYREDVLDDHEALCNCCAFCEQQCCEDI